MSLTLYSYWRSSTSYKTRIALNIKGLEYDIIPIHLVKDGGQQHGNDYKTLNPMAAVPALTDSDFTIAQSNAILEYLDEQYPEPALLPSDIRARAYVRQIRDIIACDIHPLNNLRVLQKLKNDLNVSDDEKMEWYHDWIIRSFSALEQLIENSEFYRKNGFCCGDQPTMADCALIPQMYNAHRFNVPLDNYHILNKIYNNCMKLDAFEKAARENQHDAEV